MKIFKRLTGFVKDRNVQFSILLLVVGTVSLYVFQVLFKHKKLVIGDYYAMIGLYIGSFISLFSLYNLFIKPKVRLLSFLFSALTTITIVVFINELAHAYGSGVNINISFPKPASESLEIFLIGIWIGLIIMSAIYLTLAKFKTAMPVIVVFMGALANDYYWYKDQGFEFKHFTAYLILFGVALLIASFFSFKKYEIKKSEVIDLFKSKFTALILFIFIVSAAASLYAIDWLNRTSKKIEDVRIAQTEEKERKEQEEREAQQNIGVFGQREPTSASLIGYYKADKPVHLKTEVMYLTQGQELLSVKPFYTNSEEYFNYDDRDFLDGSEEIQIIYSTVLGQPLPSAEKIVSFDYFLYSKDLGLIRPIGGFGKKLNFIEYEYSQFDPKKYKNGEYKEVLKIDEIKSFINLSKDSQRYDQIQALAQSLTKDYSDNYDKAKAIESYFESNYLYSLTPNIKDQKSPLDDFIFDTKKGYCTHFAASMVAMLESIGVRSRMVGGFYSNIYSEKLGAYVMTNKDLHAWVEVWIDGYGWVTFDPTTSRLASDTKVSDITGNARDLTNYSKTEADNIIRPLGNVKTGFDDIFSSRQSSALPQAASPLTFEETKEEWQSEETRVAQAEQKLIEEQREKEAQAAKQEELKTQRSNQFKKPFKIFLILSAIIFGMVLLWILAKYIHIRIKYKKGYAILRDQNKVRKLEQKLRKGFIKKYNLPEAVEGLSNKEFLGYLENKIEVANDMEEFYRKLDMILYGREYQKEDMGKIKELWKRIKN